MAAVSCGVSNLQSIRKLQRRILDWIVRHHPSLKLDERAEFFVRLFEKHLGSRSQVLDVGGGWGFYDAPLRRRGHELTIIDVVQPGLQMAPVILYEPGDSFPFPDKSFDTSMLITVLHHIADPEPVLQEIKRVTREYLIVVEDIYHHSLGRLWTIWRDQLYNIEFFGHPKQFRMAEEWKRFFAQRGFELVEEKNTYTWISGLRILNGVFIFRVPQS